MEKKFFKKKDVIIIVLLILVSALIWLLSDYFRAKNNLTAEIYYQNELIYSIDLQEANDDIFTLEENPNVVFEIKDHAIHFKESTCPDKICIRSGYLDQSGQMAVCLPNEMVLKIISDDENNNGPDIIAK